MSETNSRPMIPVVVSLLNVQDVYGIARVAIHNTVAEAYHDLAEWAIDNLDHDADVLEAYDDGNYQEAVEAASAATLPDYQIEEPNGHMIELPEFIEHEGKRYRIVLEEVKEQ